MASGLQPGIQYEETPEEYEGPIEFINWGGFKIAAHGASRLNAEFFREIAARRDKNQAVIIIITGPAGEGKSYFGLRFCEIFDKKFKILDEEDPSTADPSRDPSQVPFERGSFLYLVGNDSPLEYGQCILPDEAQFAAGSRRWYEELQKDLMEQIESVRSRGFIIVFVALHLDLLDKIVRKYVLTYMFHVEERGRAVVYRLYTPRFERNMHRRRLGQILLEIPNQEHCANNDCLRCPHLPPLGKSTDKKCMTLRAIYERRKRAFIGKRGVESQAKAKKKALKELQIPDEKMLEAIHNNRHKLTWGNNRRVNPVSIEAVVEEVLQFAPGPSRASRLRAVLEFRHPKIYKPQKSTRRARKKK